MADPPGIAFTVTLSDEGAIPIAFDPRAIFGRARPPVVVLLNGYRYRSTIAIMAGRTFVPLRRSHREAAGVGRGDTVDVVLTLDVLPREVDLPPDIAGRIDAEGLREVWDRLSYSHQREHVEAIASARRSETRDWRIEALIAALASRR